EELEVAVLDTQRRADDLLELPAHQTEETLARDEAERDSGLAEAHAVGGRARGARLDLLAREIAAPLEHRAETLARRRRLRRDDVALVEEDRARHVGLAHDELAAPVRLREKRHDVAERAGDRD